MVEMLFSEKLTLNITTDSVVRSIFLHFFTVLFNLERFLTANDRLRAQTVQTFVQSQANFLGVIITDSSAIHTPNNIGIFLP